MSSKWRPALIIGCLLLLTACGISPPSSTGEQTPAAVESAYHTITAEEAKAMMDDGGVTIVDVRRADEFADKHIPGAILVPNEEIGDTQPEALPDLSATLIVYCRTGVRSKQASDKLVEMGFENVYDMGGIVDWPYDTERGEAVP